MARRAVRKAASSDGEQAPIGPTSGQAKPGSRLDENPRQGTPRRLKSRSEVLDHPGTLTDPPDAAHNMRGYGAKPSA